MKIQFLRTLGVVGTLLLGCLGVTQAIAAEATGDPIVIGVMEDRSSSAAFYSQLTSKALKAYVDAVNKGNLLYLDKRFGGTPGIMGHPIKLLFEDDQSNPNLTVTQARSLVAQGAKLLIFNSGSASSVQGKVVCAEEKIFCIAATNVSDAIIQPPNNEFIFTVAPAAGFQAKTLVDGFKKVGYKKIAYISDSVATSRAVVNSYIKILTDAGFETASVEILDAGARDATPELLRIAESKPDVLLDATGYLPATVTLYRSYARLNLDLPRWGTSSLTADPQSWAEAGDAMDGLNVVDLMDPTKPELIAVRDLYQAAVGKDQPFTWLQASAWDTLMLTKSAVEKAKTVDGAAVVAAMEQTTDFPMAMGQKGYTVSYNGKHNGATQKATNIVVFEGGKPAKLWATYQP